MITNMSNILVLQKNKYVIRIISAITDHLIIKWLEKVIKIAISKLLINEYNQEIDFICFVSNKISAENVNDNEHVILIDDQCSKFDLCKIIKRFIDTVCLTSGLTSGLTAVPDQIYHDNLRFFFEAETDLMKIFIKIDLFIRGHQIFTIDSIMMNLTDLFYIDNDVEIMIRMFGDKMLRSMIEIYLNINNHVSIVDQSDLIKINNLLKNKNISIRNIFCTHDNKYANFSDPFITKEYLYEILNKNGIPANCYNSMASDKMIDLVNDIFRPLETTLNSVLDFREYPMVVIIPSYNNITIFRDTLSSVFNQNYQNYRIIFIDDCSDVVNDKLEIDEVRMYINDNNQNSRSLLLSQHIRQRQCAGRYIGYHMAYDDEIVILLDGDDRLYDNNVMKIISHDYKNKHIASSYGSYVDMYDKIIHTKIKGYCEFPKKVIINKLYRSYMYISVHLRTGFAKLFKNIRLLNLLDNNDKFFHITTDVAEMMPIHEMLTPHESEKRNLHDRIKYFDVIKVPLCIYNRDNSIIYNTSFARRNEDKNYYKQYRIDALKKIKSEQTYPFILKMTDSNITDSNITNSNITNTDHRSCINKSDKFDTRYFTDIMLNYGLDMLIIDKTIIVSDTLNTNNIQTSINSDVIKNFNTGACLYLNGKIINRQSDYVIIKALVGRNITDDEIDIIKCNYHCVIRKSSNHLIDLPVIGHISMI